MYVIIYSDVLFPRGLRIFFIFTFLLSLISILRPGLINVDFADVRTIMGDAGTALMGIGRGSGMQRMFLLRAVFLGIFFFFFFWNIRRKLSHLLHLSYIEVSFGIY